MDLLKMYFLLLALISGLKMVTCDLYWFVTTYESCDSHLHIRWILTGPSSELMWMSLRPINAIFWQRTSWQNLGGSRKFVETSSFSHMSSFQKEKKNCKFQTYLAKGSLNKSLKFKPLFFLLNQPLAESVTPCSSPSKEVCPILSRPVATTCPFFGSTNSNALLGPHICFATQKVRRGSSQKFTRLWQILREFIDTLKNDVCCCFL